MERYMQDLHTPQFYNFDDYSSSSLRISDIFAFFRKDAEKDILK